VLIPEFFSAVVKHGHDAITGDAAVAALHTAVPDDSDIDWEGVALSKADGSALELEVLMSDAPRGLLLAPRARAYRQVFRKRHQKIKGRAKSKAPARRQRQHMLDQMLQNSLHNIIS